VRRRWKTGWVGGALDDAVEAANGVFGEPPVRRAGEGGRAATDDGEDGAGGKVKDWHPAGARGVSRAPLRRTGRAVPCGGLGARTPAPERGCRGSKAVPSRGLGARWLLVGVLLESGVETGRRGFCLDSGGNLGLVLTPHATCCGGACLHHERFSAPFGHSPVDTCRQTRFWSPIWPVVPRTRCLQEATSDSRHAGRA